MTTSSEQVSGLEALFREAGAAHHQAFAATNGDDPEWPSWYAAYLCPKINVLHARPFSVKDIERFLIDAERERTTSGTSLPWPEYYAQRFPRA